MTDSIQKSVRIEAPLERVAAALSEPRELGQWFAAGGVHGSLTPGSIVVLDFGTFGKTAVYVVAIEPERVAFRWVQGETEPAVLLDDPRNHPNTLVEIQLRAETDGTQVIVTESGISTLPVSAQGAMDNAAEGWSKNLDALAKHLSSGGPA
jgi:uncharacterized protein YndB with AHSA1/START domain